MSSLTGTISRLSLVLGAKYVPTKRSARMAFAGAVLFAQRWPANLRACVPHLPVFPRAWRRGRGSDMATSMTAS